MHRETLKADLHVHSCYSTRPSQWLLQKLGCSESYTDPVRLYHLARRRGMNLVTITDHNTIAGSLDIAHLPDTFISEEITTYFPEDGCKIHVLAWAITEAQHDDITRLRPNIYDLSAYLGGNNIPHACAHAMYSMNERLTVDHMEKLILLFRTFELNGSRDAFQNNILRAILSGLTPSMLEGMAERQRMDARMDMPWVKYLTAGSDDHSSLNIARSYTQVHGVEETVHNRVEHFLAQVMQGHGHIAGTDATPETMAHNLYAIAYQFYKKRFGLARHVNHDMLLRFADRTLSASPEPVGGLLSRLTGFVGSWRTGTFGGASRSVQDQLRREALAIIAEDRELSRHAAGNGAVGVEVETAWMRFVDRASDKVLHHFADTLLDNAMGADLFSVFNAIGSAGSLYAMLSPYFVAYTLFTKDRSFARKCATHFMHGEQEQEPLHVGHFTDTLFDVNGVARTLQHQLEMASLHGKRLQVLTCAPSGDAHLPFAHRSDVRTFKPTGSFAVPEYPELQLHYPPMLRILRHCYEAGFTHLHSATPGPMGLVALAVARILKLPIHGTYHTAFPQYVMQLTGDAGLEEAMWQYMIWYYGQMDKVYVPSLATGDELVARGIPQERIAFYPRGIDIHTFTPAHRNGFFKRYPAAAQRLRLLYVGRLSREKNLHILAEAFRIVAATRTDVALVLVGDGPARGELATTLEGLPTVFTGYMEGSNLTAAYASSDLFVFPSATDTFGNVVLEAQASGLPVIVTDAGGPKENILPGRTGCIVPEGDPAALAAAILEMTANRERLATMGAAARTYAESRSFEAAFTSQWVMYREPAVA